MIKNNHYNIAYIYIIFFYIFFIQKTCLLVIKHKNQKITYIQSQLAICNVDTTCFLLRLIRNKNLHKLY
jgi:hypothetical protein